MVREILAKYYRMSVPVNRTMAGAYDFIGNTFKLSAVMVRKAADRQLIYADNIEEKGFIPATIDMVKQCMDEGEDDAEEYFDFIEELKEIGV